MPLQKGCASNARICRSSIMFPPVSGAWRPGRAKKMARYVDHLLALLPFEVQAHKQLGGPSCTYVGHPLIERLDVLRPAEGERGPLEAPGVVGAAGIKTQ